MELIYIGINISLVCILFTFIRKDHEEWRNVIIDIKDKIDEIEKYQWHDYKKEKPTKGNTYLFAKYDNLGKTIVYQVRKYNNIQYDKTYEILAWKHIEEYDMKEDKNDI